MNVTDANGFIIEQDFADADVLISHTESPEQAVRAFHGLVKSFIDVAENFTVRLYAVQFEAEDKEGRDEETVAISSKNYEHCKAVQVGAFMQVDSRVIIDLNAFTGPIVRYGHEGDDVPHSHKKED